MTDQTATALRLRPAQTRTARVTSYAGGLVHLFNKTPASIACGPFWELRWAYGCPFDCAYCYLKGTFRGQVEPRYPRPVNWMLMQLDRILHDPSFNDGRPAILNTGELSDSLMNPPIMKQIADKFEEQDRHKVLLLTKSGNVAFLFDRPRKQTIAAFSINASEVAKRWEKLTAPPAKRIEAAKLVSDAGYDTRVRIDPIFPIENWQEQYRDLIYSLISELEPNRIILGTPRGLRKTLMFVQDASWAQYFTEDTGWGKKLPTALRKEIYQFFYDVLSEVGFDKTRLSICKETTAMWRELGLEYAPLTCNCYGRG